MAHLKTPYVFLDTTEFDAANFSYTSGALSALADLAAGDRVHVFVSDIVLREVRSHIIRAVDESHQAQQKFEAKARILRNSVEKAVANRFEKLDQKKLKTELLAQFDEFLKKGKVTVMSSSGVDVKDIFDAYFDKKPPFGEGKKKAEFPDAFSLAATRSWVGKHNQSIYIVSGDRDMRSACDGNLLIAIDNLSGFLDLVAFEDKRAEFIHATTRDRFEEIIEIIKKDFEAQGFFLSDKDGDVNEVDVTSMELEDVDILSIRDDSAELELTVLVRFTADISYADLDNAAYDSEDKKFIYWETIDEKVECEESVNVTVVILLHHDEPEFFQFDDVGIKGSKIYWIDAGDGWPYK